MYIAYLHAASINVCTTWYKRFIFLLKALFKSRHKWFNDYVGKNYLKLRTFVSKNYFKLRT